MKSSLTLGLSISVLCLILFIFVPAGSTRVASSSNIRLETEKSIKAEPVIVARKTKETSRVDALVPIPVPTAPPANVQVSATDTNSASLDNATTQNEPGAAATASTVVVGWNDSNEFASTGAGGLTSITGFGFSTNAGSTFTDAGLLNPPTGMVHLGDPAIAVDSSGNFYFASLAVDSALTFDGSRVTVAKTTSTSPTVTFGTPVTINGLLTSGSPFQDKELIAVDNSNPAGPFHGRVYVAWTEFASMSDFTPKVLFARSTSTSPLAFATPIALSPTDALNHGAMPAVGPGGAVYVVWARIDSGAGTESIRLLKSIDGGVTFINPDPSDPAANKVVANVSASPSDISTGGIAIRTRGFPYITVDRTSMASPTRGYVYIVYQADPDGAGADRSDIFFTRSIDGGKNWSIPRTINRGPAVIFGGDSTTNDNVMPSIAVSPVTGQITVTFYDRRNDTTAADGDPANTRIAMVRAVSTDAGATWFNDQVSTVASKPATGYDPIFVPNSIGDYIYTVAEGANFHTAWADFRNTCSPPASAANPCSAAGRSDQDIFYAKTSTPTGPDLAITPWGHTTGVGPEWQTPDIFVVDAVDNPINAAKGTVNRLRAKVRNVGNAAATGATITFKFAPIFAGLTDSAFKTIGTVTENFAAAGDISGNDHKTIPIAWDLTNTSDTNGGQWPSPVSAFNHFCVRVSIQLAADVNLSNNDAQNNFFDVNDAEINSPIRFMIGNPSRKEAVLARLILDVPKGVRAVIEGFPSGTKKPIRLKPREIRLARIRLIPVEDYKKYPPKEDVVANIGLQVNNVLVSGFSARIAQGTTPHDNKQVEEEVRKNPDESNKAAKDKTFPVVKRGIDRVFSADAPTVFKGILRMLRELNEPVSLADLNKGLINTKSINVDNRRLREIVAKEFLEFLGKQDGRYVLSFQIKSERGRTIVRVTPLIIVTMRIENPLGGRPVASSGALEQQHLDLLSRMFP